MGTTGSADRIQAGQSGRHSYLVRAGAQGKNPHHGHLGSGVAQEQSLTGAEPRGRVKSYHGGVQRWGRRRYGSLIVRNGHRHLARHVSRRPDRQANGKVFQGQRRPDLAGTPTSPTSPALERRAVVEPASESRVIGVAGGRPVSSSTTRP